jgi:hypothetical protein
MGLLLETLPRVAGTAAGIVLMNLGHGAVVGLACISSGMVAGFAIVTAWIYRSAARAGVERLPAERLTQVLASRRHGIASMVGSQVFMSAPLAIVSVIAPAAQPLFALADKVRQLVSVGFSPVVVVLQGWVPRGDEGTPEKRSRTALIATIAIAVLFSVAFLPIAPTLVHRLGDGQIAVPQGVLVLTALVISVDLFNSVLAYAVITTLGRLEIVTLATAAGIAVMLPLTVVGTIHFGAIGALIAIVAGLLVRIAIELFGATSLRHAILDRGGLRVESR